MREIDYTKQFERDFKRQTRSPNNRDLSAKLEQLLSLLCADLPIPAKYRDHTLLGNYSGTRECHLKPDLLLIYRKLDADVLQLVRLVSHSDLF